MSRAHVVVRQVEVPTGSHIKAALKRTDFADAYEVPLARPELQVGEAYVAIFCNAPSWLQGLMNLRISTVKTEREGVFYITVSTAVEIHNTLGRVYMVVVKPFHQFLAPYLVR